MVQVAQMTSKQKTILWILLIVYIIASLAVNFWALAIAGIVLSTFSFSLYHCYLQYGKKGTFWFLGLCLGISFAMENLSVATGFPFGHYYYPDQLPGPRIGQVPSLIGLAYFGTGYVSWVLAQILTNQYSDSKKTFRWILPIFASFIMVFWDLCVDPTNSTMGHNWIWENGGAYFGVPLKNFGGWFLTVFLFYFAFNKAVPQPAQNFGGEFTFYSLPVYFYFAIGLAQVWPMFFQKYEWIKDATGKEWFTGDIFQSATLIFVFTMGWVSMLALGRLKKWF